MNAAYIRVTIHPPFPGHGLFSGPNISVLAGFLNICTCPGFSLMLRCVLFWVFV